MSFDIVVQTDQDVTITQDAADDVMVSADFAVEVIAVPDQGPPGPQGVSGRDGNTIIYGAVTPTPTTGKDGDFYINTSTGMIYGPKAASIWPPGTSLVGPTGPPGTSILYGNGAPTGGTGNNGDFYIATNINNLYGPKTNNVWPTGISLVGPQGIQGLQGIQGVAGPTGATGPAGTVARGHIAGLRLSAAGGSTTFGVAIGQAADSTAAFLIPLASAFTKTTGAWTVGSAGGALDTGTIAASTWYHAFLIRRTDNSGVDVLVSLSPTAPTLPSPYTQFRRIGSLLTGGSSNWLAFSQQGDEFLWGTPVNDVNNAAVPTGSVPTLYGLTVPTGIKVNALFHLSAANGASAGASVLVSSPDQTATAAGTPLGNQTITNANTTTTARMDMNLRTNTSGQIQAVGNTASTFIFITTYGWIDTRGKDD